MTDLDRKLHDLAVVDWDRFIQLMGEAAIVMAKASLLREEGKSYNQISIKLKISQAQVRYACKNKSDKKYQPCSKS